MPLLRLACLFTCLLPWPALADLMTLAIPEQGWSVQFDVPALRPVREVQTSAHYLWTGNAGQLSVTLSVDTPACTGDASHAAALQCFLPHTAADPLIRQDSLSQQCSSQFCRVSYLLENTFQERTIRQQHVHYLFAYRNKWSGLHVSVSNPTDNDLKMLQQLEASLHYQ